MKAGSYAGKRRRSSLFDQKYLQHLESENAWLKSQVEELQSKLFKAMRLDVVAAEASPKVKWDEGQKQYVPMSPEEIHSEAQALQELLAQNV